MASRQPGQHRAIGAFCDKNDGVAFPLFEKVNVNDSNAHALFDLHELDKINWMRCAMPTR